MYDEREITVNPANGSNLHPLFAKILAPFTRRVPVGPHASSIDACLASAAARHVPDPHDAGDLTDEERKAVLLSVLVEAGMKFTVSGPELSKLADIAESRDIDRGEFYDAVTAGHMRAADRMREEAERDRALVRFGPSEEYETRIMPEQLGS